MMILRNIVIVLLFGMVLVRLDGAVQRPGKNLSEEAVAVKGHTRVTVNSGKELRKLEVKGRAYYNGGYRKELRTQKSVEVKIRNTGMDTVEYTVDYYFVAKPLAGGNDPEIFDRGSKTVSCEVNRNVNLEIKSKELKAIDRRASAASPPEKIGLEADGYFVCIKLNDEELMSFCSRQGEKYEQSIRDQIENKKTDKDEKVKVTGN